MVMDHPRPILYCNLISRSYIVIIGGGAIYIILHHPVISKQIAFDGKKGFFVFYSMKARSPNLFDLTSDKSVNVNSGSPKMTA